MEVGGTVGDIESMLFLEALRQFQWKVGKENFLLVHVRYKNLILRVSSELFNFHHVALYSYLIVQ